MNHVDGDVTQPSWLANCANFLMLLQKSRCKNWVIAAFNQTWFRHTYNLFYDHVLLQILFFLIEISYNYQCCTLLQVYNTSCLVKFISLTFPYTMYHTKRVFICVMSPETDIYACSFSYATYVWPENIEKNKVLFCSVENRIGLVRLTTVREDCTGSHKQNLYQYCR